VTAFELARSGLFSNINLDQTLGIRKNNFDRRGSKYRGYAITFVDGIFLDRTLVVGKLQAQ
jgi:hypothetical protein